MQQHDITQTVRGKETPFIRCPIRRKPVQLKPEELIRQLYAARLLNQYQYPPNRVRFEHLVNFGREKKRADIVILDKDRPDTPFIIIEVKKPKLQDGKDQLRHLPTFPEAADIPYCSDVLNQAVELLKEKRGNVI